MHCVADGHATARKFGTPVTPVVDSFFACRPAVATGLNVASMPPSPTVTHSVAEMHVVARIAVCSTPVSSVGADHDSARAGGGAYCSASVNCVPELSLSPPVAVQVVADTHDSPRR